MEEHHIHTFLPAATKLGQGNIFTSVCQEFCPRGGGVCLSAKVIFSQACVKNSVHGGGGVCLSAKVIFSQVGVKNSVHRGGLPQCMLGYPTPRTRHTHPHPPDQAHHPPRTRHTSPPGPGTPPPGRRLQHTVNERPVRILLECILVHLCQYLQRRCPSPLPTTVVTTVIAYLSFFHDCSDVVHHYSSSESQL